jgi:hypothetical protein
MIFLPRAVEVLRISFSRAICSTEQDAASNKMPRSKARNEAEIDSRLCFAPNRIPAVTDGVISRTRTYQLLKTGQLKARRIGRRTIILAEDLRECLAALPDRSTR